MSAVIIRKKDVDRLANKLITNIFEFMNDDYFFLENGSESEEMKKIFKKMVKSRNIFLKKIGGLNINDIKTKQIYDILKSVYIYFEIDEDLYNELKAFLSIYETFEFNYTYLE